MRIGIIGGTGNAGQALCAGAVNRGHQAKAIVRKPDFAPGDATGCVLGRDELQWLVAS